jgi:hypothetical protein
MFGDIIKVIDLFELFFIFITYLILFNIKSRYLNLFAYGIVELEQGDHDIYL